METIGKHGGLPDMKYLAILILSLFISCNETVTNAPVQPQTCQVLVWYACEDGYDEEGTEYMYPRSIRIYKQQLQGEDSLVDTIYNNAPIPSEIIVETSTILYFNLGYFRCTQTEPCVYDTITEEIVVRSDTTWIITD
jgi:hypothetical protein